MPGAVVSPPQPKASVVARSPKKSPPHVASFLSDIWENRALAIAAGVVLFLAAATYCIVGLSNGRTGAGAPAGDPVTVEQLVERFKKEPLFRAASEREMVAVTGEIELVDSGRTTIYLKRSDKRAGKVACQLSDERQLNLASAGRKVTVTGLCDKLHRKTNVMLLNDCQIDTR